jgi:hypothetical protein
MVHCFPLGSTLTEPVATNTRAVTARAMVAALTIAINRRLSDREAGATTKACSAQQCPAVCK